MVAALRFFLMTVIAALAVASVYILGISQDWYGEHRGTGQIAGERLPQALLTARTVAQSAVSAAAGAPDDKQILFGDLHVHTTFSTDAFLWSLPIMGGEGVHPLADACDYARFCSGIDFWAITDHAEALTPRKWAETRDAVRQCNALAGDADNPDLTVFTGYEWTQVGAWPQDHYGHKNVIFRDLDDGMLSARPIAAAGTASQVLRGSATGLPITVPLLDFANRSDYYDFRRFADEVRSVPACDPALPSNALPEGCYETAATPGELVRRLEQQGLAPLIIPHGTTWGFYTPPGTTLDKQLRSSMRPERFTLIEIMSGHGNSEEYRPWRAAYLEDGEPACPAPTRDYLPSCWQAGEIIRDRCRAEGGSETDCDARAADARAASVRLGIAAHVAVPGARPEDWLDAGQCRDCFLPSFNYRPGGSAQYGLALGNFEDPDDPVRFNWGFIASSDNHRARPGTGYKEFDRLRNTEAVRIRDEKWLNRLFPKRAPTAQAEDIDRDQLLENPGFGLTERERQASFWLTGGLAAVHARGRDREAVWDGLQRRETYATSGPRILLWFDLLEPGGGRVPMGSDTTFSGLPEFQVRAVGSFRQKPGCPDYGNALDSERLQALCGGECYHPSDQRHRIQRIEVIRIQRQQRPDEPVEALIEDPWQVLPCPTDAESCVASFRDEEYQASPRDTVYYVRAIQEATDAVNADNLRCEYDADGACIKTRMCYGDYRSDAGDDCLASNEERAWSSPIYLSMQ